MKYAIYGSLVALSALATPQISDVTAEQNPTTGMVEISYRLSEDAIVTLDDLLDGGLSLGASNVTSCAGHVAVKVKGGDGVLRKIIWNAPKDVPGKTFTNTLTAKLTAWSLSSPPNYLVVDLVAPAATNFFFYATEANLPEGGITNDVYRTTKLVMRRIPAAGVVFRMGDSTDTPVRGAEHYEKFSEDWYCSIFHLTQGQYAQVISTSLPSTANCKPHANDAPICGLSYDALRGTNGWPEAGHAVPTNSVIGKFRTRTGLMLDLPTDAQWEYSCRAGTSARFNNGSGDTTRALELGWYSWFNSNSQTYSGNATGVLHRVGIKLPNKWGLYDMHGQTFVWCLDWAGGDDDWESDDNAWFMHDYNGPRQQVTVGGQSVWVNVDPAGPASTGKTAKSGASYVNRAVRGGGCANGVNNAYSHFRHGIKPTSNNLGYTGARFVCPVPEL